MSLVAWLIAMVGPLAARLLVALGVSLITISGAVVTVAAFKTQVLGAIGAMPLAAAQLGGLMGFWEAIGMWLGVYTFMLTYKGTAGFMALKKT